MTLPAVLASRLTVPVLLFLLAAPVQGQQSTRLPSVALIGGLGNVLGGLGAGLEYFVAGSHVSASAGFGYWPSDLCAGTASGAGAVRAFFGGRHRGFVEASYSLLAISCDFSLPAQNDHHYGPGISAGYRYTGSDGFTFTAGVGVGDPSGNESGAETMILIGAGYTWRR